MEHVFGTVLTVAEANKILLVNNCFELGERERDHHLHLALCSHEVYAGNYHAYTNMKLESQNIFNNNFIIIPYSRAPTQDLGVYSPWTYTPNIFPYTGYIIGKRQSCLGHLDFTAEDEHYLKELTRGLITKENTTGYRIFHHYLIQFDHSQSRTEI